MVLLQYFPQRYQLFVLGLGKLDPPGMDPNHKLAMGLPQKPALNLVKLHLPMTPPSAEAYGTTDEPELL